MLWYAFPRYHFAYPVALSAPLVFLLLILWSIYLPVDLSCIHVDHLLLFFCLSSDRSTCPLIFLAFMLIICSFFSAYPLIDLLACWSFLHSCWSSAPFFLLIFWSIYLPVVLSCSMSIFPLLLAFCLSSDFPTCPMAFLFSCWFYFFSVFLLILLIEIVLLSSCSLCFSC